jgi:hypothetical protein
MLHAAATAFQKSCCGQRLAPAAHQTPGRPVKSENHRNTVCVSVTAQSNMHRVPAGEVLCSGRVSAYPLHW